MKTLLIIDSHALIHRAFHALPPMSTKDGTPTNAVYGYFGMLQKAIIDLKPDYLVTCFDTPTESFRAQLIETYQATRPPTEDALKSQFNLVKDVVDAAGIARYEAPGYEADDAIGTIAIQASTDPELRIIILSGDKDIFQLVTDCVLVLTPQIGFSKAKLYDPPAVVEKMGVPPVKVPDFKALSGDASDNYGGIRSIGPKTAAKLIAQYGTVENMEGQFDAETMEKLRVAKKVATIVTDVPGIQYDPQKAEFSGFQPEMKDVLTKLELYSLVNRFFKPPAEPKAKPKPVTKEEPEDVGQETLF